MTMPLRTIALLLLAGTFAWAGPAVAQSPAPLALTVELGDVSATKVPFIVAAESGIYARNGLAVRQFISPLAAEVAKNTGLVVPAENVGTGHGDICICGGSPTIVQMTLSAVAPQRIILATTDTSEAFRIYARSGIRNVADLKGKRVGYLERGDLIDLSWNALARRMGWDPNMDWSMLSNVNGMDVAAQYHVDALLGAPLAGPEAIRLGYRDIGSMSPYHFVILGSGVAALKSWLPTHRAAAAAFVKSTIEAIALIKHDKAAAFSAMEKWYGLNDLTREQALYNAAVRLEAKPYPSEDGLALVRRLYTWRNMEDHPVSYFLDPSFVAALDRSGYIDRLYKK